MPATGDKRPHSGSHGDAVKRAKPSGDPMAAARAAAAALAARIAANKPQSNGASPSPSPAPVRAPAAPTTPATPAATSSAAKLEAVKARLAALKASSKINSKIEASAAAASDPFRPPVELDTRRPDPRAADSTRKEPTAPPAEEKHNPYFDPKSVPAGKQRASRTLLFNSRGKYLEQASKLRAQARLEEIKKTLAVQARRAGLDENNERGFVVQPPPDVEWWDEGLLDEKTYDCIENPDKVKIDGDDSIITIYIQHPALVKAPQDKRLIETKPMYLTQKEQAKLRRMRRAEDLKEHQAKIRLGLEPPPPPKVKRGNMMRVMGEQAIADPTAVEMLVESQIAQRHEDHVKANEERKLTKEERHAKLEQNQQNDAAKGLYMCVFKINTLAYGKHRYQIDQNAKQLALTGITIFNPKMCLVIVEGGIHSINRYKKLLLNRIRWSEAISRPTEIQAEKQASEPQWMRSLDENGDVKDISHNRCKLIFEGELKQRAFRKWGSKVCETDGEARAVLLRSKIDSMWGLALTTGPE